MMRHPRFLVLIVLLCLFSCQETPKKIAPLIQFVDGPAGAGSALPFLYANDKVTLLSWVEPVGDSVMVLKYSALEGEKWSAPKEIVKGKDWFVNWADFPAIAENKGHLLSHVLKKSSSGTYSYDVKLNLKQKEGPAWETDLPLHSDNTPTEHGFVTALAFNDGFFVTWLDGRNTVENALGERGAMTIRAAEVSLNGRITNAIELDARTCDCCQTTAAITDNGPVVIYRDRSEEEIRDISIVRKVAGEWSAPKSIYNDGWEIKGCPVNGPKAAVLNNQLAIAWFTAANDSPLVNVIFSEDGGATFDAPIRIAEANTMGRVDVLLFEKDKAIVSWMETSKGQALIKAIRIDQEGSRGEVKVITALDATRKTGFPQMEQVGDSVYFAWTDVVGDNTNVKMARVALAHF